MKMKCLLEIVGLLLKIRIILKCLMAFAAGGFSVALVDCDCRDSLLVCPRRCRAFLAEGHEDWFLFVNVFEPFEIHFCGPRAPRGSRGTCGVHRKCANSPGVSQVSLRPCVVLARCFDLGAPQVLLDPSWDHFWESRKFIGRPLWVPRYPVRPLQV